MSKTLSSIIRTVVLAVVLAWSIPATGHHSQAMYFQIDKAITLEGEIVRVEWINPHVLLFLQSKKDKGQSETWILHGHSLNNALRKVGPAKDRLKPGTVITARAHPSRNPLYVNDAQTVLLTKPDDTRKSPYIVGVGEIKFSNGDVVELGGGPKF